MANKKRSYNFTPPEVDLLMNLVKSRWSVIECKKPEAHMWQKKSMCWQDIEKVFNNSSTIYRPVNVLRKKWDNIKKSLKSKQKMSDDGSSLPEASLSQMEIDILSRLQGKTDDLDMNDGDFLMAEIEVPGLSTVQDSGGDISSDGSAGTSSDEDPLEPGELTRVERHAIENQPTQQTKDDSDIASVRELPKPRLLKKTISPRLRTNNNILMRKQSQYEKRIRHKRKVFLLSNEEKKQGAELTYMVNTEKREAEAHTLRLKWEAEEHELRMKILKKELELLEKK